MHGSTSLIRQFARCAAAGAGFHLVGRAEFHLTRRIYDGFLLMLLVLRSRPVSRMVGEEYPNYQHRNYHPTEPGALSSSRTTSHHLCSALERTQKLIVCAPNVTGNTVSRSPTTNRLYRIVVFRDCCCLHIKNRSDLYPVPFSFLLFKAKKRISVVTR